MVQSKQNETKKDPREGTGSPAGTNRNVIFLLVGATVFAFLAIAVLALLNAVGGGGAESFIPNDEGLLPVGAEAPEFTAETVRDGGDVAVGDGSAQATMLVFFATWCRHCNNEALGSD